MTVTTVPTGLPTIAGKAFYIELKPLPNPEGSYRYGGREGDRTQLIITPKAVNELGHDVLPYVYQRDLSEYYPRSQWGRSHVRPSYSEKEILEDRAESLAKDPRGYFHGKNVDLTEFQEYSDEVKKEMYANELRWLIKSLCLSETRSYNEETKEYESEYYVGKELVTKFAVEITSDDIQAISQGKTPQAIIRRVMKTRKSLGLPEKVFVETK